MTAPARPEPGTRLLFRWRKWDGSPHWQHECLYLGSDEHGDWFGQPAGWPSSRPGREILPTEPCVTLVPPSGDYTFTHNAPPHRTSVYIDLAWDVGFAADGMPVGIDMDLDVVRREPAEPYVDREGVRRMPGEAYIEDRDEWDEHRVAMGYPVEIVARLEDRAADLLQRVRAAEAPFDGPTADRWLERLTRLQPGEGA